MTAAVRARTNDELITSPNMLDMWKTMLLTNSAHVRREASIILTIYVNRRESNDWKSIPDDLNDDYLFFCLSVVRWVNNHRSSCGAHR